MKGEIDKEGKLKDRTEVLSTRGCCCLFNPSANIC